MNVEWISPTQGRFHKHIHLYTSMRTSNKVGNMAVNEQSKKAIILIITDDM